MKFCVIMFSETFLVGFTDFDTHTSSLGQECKSVVGFKTVFDILTSHWFRVVT